MSKRTTNIEKQTQKVLYSMFSFARFSSEFSKWVSLVLVLCWIFAYVVGWIFVFLDKEYPSMIMDFAKEPMLIVLGFYYSTKTIENVSKGVCAYLNNKLKIKNEETETSFDESEGSF